MTLKGNYTLRPNTRTWAKKNILTREQNPINIVRLQLYHVEFQPNPTSTPCKKKTSPSCFDVVCATFEPFGLHKNASRANLHDQIALRDFVTNVTRNVDSSFHRGALIHAGELFDRQLLGCLFAHLRITRFCLFIEVLQTII